MTGARLDAGRRRPWSRALAVLSLFGYGAVLAVQMFLSAVSAGFGLGLLAAAAFHTLRTRSG